MKFFFEIRSRLNPHILLKSVDVTNFTKLQRDEIEDQLEQENDKRYYFVKQVIIKKGEHMKPIEPPKKQYAKGEKRKIETPDYYYKVENRYSEKQKEILKELGLEYMFLK